MLPFPAGGSPAGMTLWFRTGQGGDATAPAMRAGMEHQEVDMKKRIISLILAAVLCISLLPATALADAAQNASAPAEGGSDENPAAPQSTEGEASEQEGGGETVENPEAEINGKLYERLFDALDEVKTGDTIKLLNNISHYPDNIVVKGETYTLDLNGFEIDEPMSVIVRSGGLTVVDSSADKTGIIDELSFRNGSLTIESGNIGRIGTWYNGSGSINITGGTVESFYARSKDIKVQISGGTFTKVANEVTGGKVADLLADGYALAYSDTDEIVNYYKAYSASGGDRTLSVVLHEHDMSTGTTAGKCACGADFEACVTADGKNSYYDKLEDAFAQTTGGEVKLLKDITGLRSIYISGGPYTFDLNGYKVGYEGEDTSVYAPIMVGDMDESESLISGTLTVIDSSESKRGHIRNLNLWDGELVVKNGNFHRIIEYGSDSTGTISIEGGTAEEVKHTSAGVTVKISGGTFISVEDVLTGKVTDLLADGYAFQNSTTGDWVPNVYAWSTAGNVKVVEHPKHNTNGEDGACECGYVCTNTTKMDETGCCPDCGKPLAEASLTAGETTTYYISLSDAIGAAMEQHSSTVTLLKNATLAKDAGIYIDSASGCAFTIDWNGNTLSGNANNLLTIDRRANVTLKDSSEKNSGGVRNSGGAAVKASMDGSGSVIIEGGTYSPRVLKDGVCYGTVKISGGVFENPLNAPVDFALYNAMSGGKLADMLVPNYTFAYADDDSLLNVYGVECSEKGRNVKVVAHQHDIPADKNACTCGYVCDHKTVDADGKCNVCKKQMAAMVTKDYVSHTYTTVDAALAEALEISGSTLKLLRDADGAVSITDSRNVFYLDLNGKNMSALTVSGTNSPKLMDSKSGGTISNITYRGGMLAALLHSGWGFKKSGTWLTADELFGTGATNVSVAKIPIKSMDYPTEMSMTYGGTGTLLVTVKKETGTGAVRFQWYKVEDGKETAVGSATTKNQFDLAAQKLPAGNHTFRCSATCDGYKKMSQDIAVTVGKASISANRITPPTAQENLTYTGQEQALITAGSVTSGGTMQYSLTENGTYSQDTPTGTDAGAYTVWYRVIGDANHNDTEPASVAVRIGTKPLTITGVTAASKPYDGTTDADISSVTFDNVTLNRGTDYTVTASFDDASVGSGKNVTATVTLMGQAAKNYALEQSSFMTTASITKAAAPDFTKETALVIVNGHEKTYTVTLPALPTLETPKEYGAPTYELGEIKLDGGYYTSGAKVENGKLILSVEKNDVDTTGPIGTVTVKVTTTNYEDITLTVNVSAENKIVPTGQPTLQPDTITYGDTLGMISLSGTLHDDVNNVDVEGTFSWVNPETTPDAGTYAAEWRFTPKDGETYLETSGQATITVNRATPAGEPKYTRITSGGRTLADAKLTANDSWPAGTVEWVDADGNVLPDETAVKANTPYTWRFAPTNTANYETISGKVTLYTVSNSGGSNTPVYPVRTPDKTENGTISTDPKSAEKGETVTITVKPDTGYELGDLIVTDKNGDRVNVINRGNGKFTFVMPDGGVTIRASFVEETENSPFRDVPKNAYYYKAVAWAAKNGITGGIGNGLFGPELGCTRAQFVTFLWRACGSPAPKALSRFTDVPADAYYAKAVAWAVENGITDGTSPTTFSPNQTCTRAHAVTFLWRALGKPSGSSAAFTDVPSGAYYAKAVAWAAENDVTTGVGGGRFAPDDTCTRAQIVTFLYRCMR